MQFKAVAILIKRWACVWKFSERNDAILQPYLVDISPELHLNANSERLISERFA